MAVGARVSSPVGRAAEAAVCKTAQKGATPLRDSISFFEHKCREIHAGGRPQGPSKQEYRARYLDARPFHFPQLCPGCRQRPRTVGVMAGCRVQCAGEFFSERSLKVRRVLREQEQAGALPAALTISRDAIAGANQDLTGLAAAVQLRLRVATFFQGYRFFRLKVTG